MAERERYDIEIYRGATSKKDARYKINDSPVDLTDYTVRAQIRPQENSETLTAEITCEVTAEQGLIEMSLGPEETVAIAPGTYFWDLKITDEAGEADVDIYGKAVVKGRVTE